MSIDNHIITDEEITGNVHCAKNVKYYVTNKRVIRYKSSMGREEMDDVLCGHITSISLVSVARKAMWVIGLLLMIIGIAGIVVNMLQVIPDEWNPYFSYASYVLGGLGFLLFILAFVLKKSVYQFFAAGLTPDIAPRWRIEGVSADKARAFIRLVREAN